MVAQVSLEISKAALHPPSCCPHDCALWLAYRHCDSWLCCQSSQCALVLQPHLHLTSLPYKSEYTALKIAVIVTIACRHGPRRKCGIFELGPLGDVDLGVLIADEDVQMMSCIGKHMRSEFGGSWGVVWRFWSDLLEGEHSEYCLFVWP